jgi:hypothetical protein
MRVRPIVPVLVLLAVAGLAERADACFSQYVSEERFLNRAGVIVEIEVVEPGAGPPPVEGGHDPDDARALVRVLQRLRGEFPLEEFTLLGGPVASCAIGGAWARFAPGQRLFLVLDEPPPAGTRSILVCHYGRMFRGTEEDLRARLAWTRGCRLCRLRVFEREYPEDYPLAVRLRAAILDDDNADLSDATLPALVALRELLTDPDRPLPAPEIVSEGFTFRGGISTRYGRPDRYITDGRGNPPVLVRLREEIEARRKNDSDPFLALNRRLLRRYLVECLLQPPERADRFVAAVGEKELRESSFPFRRLRLEKDADRDLISILRLRRFADEEPDDLVRRGHYGVRWGKLDVDVFRPWLERHGETVPAIWSRVLIGLALLDPVSAPLVDRAEFNGWPLTPERRRRYDEALAR